MAVTQMSGVTDMVSGMFSSREEPRRLSYREQVQRFLSMSQEQQTTLRRKVGNEEFSRYEAAMQKLTAEGY